MKTHAFTTFTAFSVSPRPTRSPVRGALLGALLGTTVFLGTSAWAQTAPVASSASATAKLSQTEGEIKRVDKSAGKLTIKHGPIQNLDMPGMTMVFVARDSGALDSLKAGDKIRFVATNESGKYIASDIQAAP